MPLELDLGPLNLDIRLHYAFHNVLLKILLTDSQDAAFDVVKANI